MKLSLTKTLILKYKKQIISMLHYKIISKVLLNRSKTFFKQSK